MRVSRLLIALSLAASVTACNDFNPGVGTDAPSGPPCSDGADNDNDGTIDFPDDLGCEDEQDDSEDSAARTQCDDNRDNDGDGKTDFPNDPGCPVPQADDESDPCPNGAGCPQCGDGKDNDGNGKTDFPQDTGCTSAYDGIEFTDDPNACGQGMVIKPLPSTGTDMGTLVGTSSTVSSPCGGGNGLPAIAYVVHLTTPKVMVATTDDPMTMIDTVLDLRTSMCSTAGAEVTCHDDILPGTTSTANKKSKITRSLRAGTYYLIVGGKTAADTGQYLLKVEFLPGEGTPCTSVTDCGPTLECRIPVGQTTMQCAGPVCFDGIDDDGDGKIDYPLDPGCATPTDTTETDVCTTMPTSAQCPQCANGLDDDTDGMTDYPADTSCLAASTMGEACPQSETVIVATTAQTMGTTVGATNDSRPPVGQFNGHACSTTSLTTATAPDVTVQIDVPAMDNLSLRLSPVGFDSSQILFGSSCTGTPIDCYDSPTLMNPTNLAAGRYYLIIDGYSSGSGTFTLNISGNIKNGESCESPLAQAGALTCGPGYECGGTPGSRTCVRTQCNDTLDNNTDGRSDYPADPGCTSISDTTENTVCPGASCPVCSDGLDNDNDGATDYPTDQDCVAASATNEGCPDSDQVVAITSPTTTGTLVGATDDHNPACVATNLPDKVFTLDIPTTLQSLDIDTEGSVVDTVLSFMGSTCSEPAIACDDDGGVGVGDSLIHRTLTPAGSYSIAVDSDSTTLGTFILNVRGVVAPGGSCESALFQAGVLVCPPNFGCNGPVGSRTCGAAECLDGADNNGDGLADYPNDPGCTSANDNIEDTVCPGSSCPACSDGIDNDSDGRTDYPADPRCVSASGTNEGCFDTDGVTAILMPSTSDTLVGRTNDHQPGCTTTAGVDKIYSLAIPNLESLTINTDASSVDTVLSLMTSDCAEPALECDDDDGIGTASLISRGFTAAGTYTIAVDADTTTPNSYILNVSGVISPGASCESPLFATGVLRCSLGFACDGPVGMRTCALAQCIDGVDNDSDGATDFPADVGCTSFSDNSETNPTCPGPQCPVCSDGLDNDGDGATDFPADTSCLTASWNTEACTQSEPVAEITSGITYGDTSNQTNDYQPTCGSSTAHVAGDQALRLELPAMTSLSLNLVSSGDNTTTLLNSTCGGAPLQCSDPQLMTRTNVAAGTYYVIVDGYSSFEGPWVLTTSGTVAPGGSCEGALFQSGAFTCGVNYSCAGALGSRTCTPSQCSDATDSDGDGKNGYPTDPGCSSLADNDESDDCFPTVGPSCPACANGVDDDQDLTIDHPMDTRCVSADFFLEDFCPAEVNVAGMIGQRTTIGTLAGMANNFTQSCQATTGNDITYGLRLPVPVATLVIDTIGSVASDTIVSLRTTTCTTELGCDDDGDPAGNRSLLTVTNLAAGNYAVQVDAFSTSNNTGITLNVVGTVAPGTVCTDPLFASGVLACPTGTSCTGGICQ